MRPVLALDVARRLGWASPGGGGPARHGVVDFGADPVGRLFKFEDWLVPRLAAVRSGEGLLIYERVITTRFRNAIRAACHLEAVLLMTARTWGIPKECIRVVTPQGIKISATGDARATKADVMAAINEKHGLAITDDNESDALALLDVALEDGW